MRNLAKLPRIAEHTQIQNFANELEIVKQRLFQLETGKQSVALKTVSMGSGP